LGPQQRFGTTEPNAGTSVLRLVLRAWGALCLAGWAVLGARLENAEAQCRAGYGFFCLPSGMGLLLVAMAAVVVWLIGAFLIWLVNAILKTRT
jgi:hypothetical protein